MFAWTSVAHMALPLGDAGFKEFPNEQPVMTALQASLGNAGGLYIYPGMGLAPDASASQKQDAYAKKVATSPSGILIYQPPATTPPASRQLTVEFLTELLECLLVVFLLAQTRLSSFAGRFGFVFAAGVLATLATNVSYWNWYGFPVTYTAAYMTTEIIGFLCVGLVAAALVKQPKPASAAVAA